MKTILIVEDDTNLSHGISFSLEKEGFTVYCANTLSEGENIFNQHAIDIIILDLNLPDGDGIDFCRAVREKSSIPILMLTARDLELDELSGLLAGADDYITKPFSVSILHARVDSLLRRYEDSDKSVIYSGMYKLNTHAFKFYCNDTEIPVSATEFRILRLFMTSGSKILTKEQVSSALWENHKDYVDDNTLSVNISRLRSKIESNPKKPVIIKTVHGIGYCWCAGG